MTEKPQKASIFQQIWVLLYKQSLLLKNNKVNTFLRYTFPFWLMIIMIIIVKNVGKGPSSNYNSPTSVFINYKTNSNYYLMYSYINSNNTPTSPDMNIMNSIANQLKLDVNVDFAPVLAGFETDQKGLVKYQQETSGQKTSFASVYFWITNQTSVYYTYFYNSGDSQLKNGFVFTTSQSTVEGNYALGVRVAIENALLSNYTKSPTPQMDINLLDPPNNLGLRNKVPANLIVSMFTPVALWFGMTFPFILFVYTIVEEKERKIRSYIRLFGVFDTIYYSSWLLDGVLCTFINTILVLIAGYSNSSILFFSHTSPSVIFIALMVYGISLTAFAILLASLLSRTKAAVIIAVILFLVALIVSVMMSMLGSQFYAIYDSKLKNYAWLLLWVILTPLNISKVFLDIQIRVLGSNIFQQSGASMGYYYWSDFDAPIPVVAPRHITTTFATVNYMFIALIIYLLLAWYFDKVIPDDFGGRRSPLFLFDPHFWFPNNDPNPIFENDLIGYTSSNDPDIQEEARCVTMSNFDNFSLIVRNIVKKYGNKRVVDKLSITAERGKILALLGHNGAGKTTLINMISGQTNITEGEVFIHGYSVSKQIDQIKSMIGLTPQFDVYWPDFTARQHLTIMTQAKEYRPNIAQDIDEILKSVRLSSVADNPVSSFSGGMRRRLSVAMGIIGNPQVIILDEPTTGIDVSNRRYIWRLIKSIKKDKLVLLTSHAMEECDQLGDKIIIMNEGKVTCSGTSLHLKNKFGSGYKLHMVSSNVVATQELVRNKLAGAQLIRINSNNIIYSVASMSELSPFLRYLTSQPHPEITDWQIQNTSLEDVFLQLVDEKKSK